MPTAKQHHRSAVRSVRTPPLSTSPWTTSTPLDEHNRSCVQHTGRKRQTSPLRRCHGREDRVSCAHLPVTACRQRKTRSRTAKTSLRSAGAMDAVEADIASVAWDISPFGASITSRGAPAHPPCRFHSSGNAVNCVGECGNCVGSRCNCVGEWGNYVGSR